MSVIFSDRLFQCSPHLHQHCVQTIGKESFPIHLSIDPFPKYFIMPESEIEPSPSAPKEVRPYRSHKFPACDRCRRRKARCIVESKSDPCRLCQIQNAICTRLKEYNSSKNCSISGDSEVPTKTRPSTIPSPSAKRHQQLPPSEPWKNFNGHSSSSYRSRGPSSVEQSVPIYERRNDSSESISRAATDDPNKSAIIVGPVMAEDIQVVTQYLTNQSLQSHRSRVNIYDTVSDNPKDPILYLQVPRHRLGLALKGRPGESQQEILEQILGPLANELISV